MELKARGRARSTYLSTIGKLNGVSVKMQGSGFESDCARKALHVVSAGGSYNHRVVSQRAERELHSLTVDFPRSIGLDLIAPIPDGAEVRYARMHGRNVRWFPIVETTRSRSNSFTMLLSRLPHDSRGQGSFLVISAFVGEDNPPSPTDMNIRNDFELLRASTEFWSSHAFVVPDAFKYTPLNPHTEQERCPWL